MLQSDLNQPLFPYRRQDDARKRGASFNQNVQNVTFWIVTRQIELSFGRLVYHKQIKLHFT